MITKDLYVLYDKYESRFVESDDKICPWCHTCTLKKEQVFSLPQTLVIVLKRYKWTGTHNEKILSKVIPERTIEFISHARDVLTFDLKSIVSHKGDSATTGHYMADIIRW